MLLTYGHVIENHTLIKNVNRLPAGHYLEYSNGLLHEVQYHRFSNFENKNMSYKEAIDTMDSLFQQAVKRQFDKDLEYGYKHIASLSGGLDSRMTVWVAHELGYIHQLNVTMSQSDYDDFIIAQQISKDLKHSFLFESLDNGLCLYDLEIGSKMSYGNVTYTSTSKALSLYEKINLNQYGVVHSGILGDVIIDSYTKFPSHKEFSLYRNVGVDKNIYERWIPHYSCRYQYANDEIFMLYNRGMCYITPQGLIPIADFTEEYSPFCDIDFFEFCLHLPMNWRHNHRIYFDWIISKYPRAANYIWESKHKTVKELVENNNKKESIGITLLVNRILSLKVLHFAKRCICYFYSRIKTIKDLEIKNEKVTPINTPNHMNPLGYWYNTNTDLKCYLDDYFRNNYEEQKSKNNISKELLDCLLQLYQGNNTLNKLSVLTTLSVLQMACNKQ